VTLELSDADFVAMANGQADAQKLYFGGKLKIGGNVMASQKLEFLKKIDRGAAETAYAAAAANATGGATAAPAPAAAAASGSAAAPPESPKQAKSPLVFAALKDKLAKAPADIPGVIQFEVRNPNKSFFVDAKSVSEGTAAAKSATVTVRVDEDDLLALAKGQATPQDLFMQGKLRIDGDVPAARELGFLRNLL